MATDIVVDIPESTENTPLLVSSAPAERYFPQRFYTGQDLTSISEEKDDGHGFHNSLPSPTARTRSVSISEAFDRYVRIRRTSKQMDSLWDRIRYRVRPQTFAFMHIAAATILLTGVMIFQPLYTGGLLNAGSDPYVGAMLAATWFPVILGLMMLIIKLFIHRTLPMTPPLGWKKLLFISGSWAVSYLLIMYCSPPSRLPVHLQPLVTSLVVPISALARYIFIKKGVNRLQFLCLMLHVFGIFVSTWPIVFNIGGKDRGLEWLHLLLFVLALFPGVFGFVFAIKSLSDRRAHTFSLLPWIYVLLLAGLFLTFWTNFIPGIGTVTNVPDYVKHVEKGFTCFYGQGNVSSSCNAIPARSALYLLTSSIGLSILVVILRFKDGLLYLAVIIGFSSLFATVFWSLFLDDNLNVNFFPRLDAGDSLYLLVGLGVVVLATVSFLFLGFTNNSPRAPTYVPPRVRRSSFSRSGSLKFAKPEQPPKKKRKAKRTKKSKSAPNFNVYF